MDCNFFACVVSYWQNIPLLVKMKRFSLKMMALMAAVMMSLTVQAKTQDWGGRVIDEKGEPMPYVNVVLLSLPDSAFVQGGMTDEQGMFNPKRSLGFLSAVWQ